MPCRRARLSNCSCSTGSPTSLVRPHCLQTMCASQMMGLGLRQTDSTWYVVVRENVSDHMDRRLYVLYDSSAIAKRVCVMQSWGLEVVSPVVEGRGTRFTLTFH